MGQDDCMGSWFFGRLRFRGWDVADRRDYCLGSSDSLRNDFVNDNICLLFRFTGWRV